MTMRSIIQLALVALVLFGVSAALSVWLNQSRLAETGKGAKDPEAGKSAAAGGKDEKAGDKAARPQPKDDKAAVPEAGPAAVAAEVRAREDRLERRQAQMDLVLRDLQAERDAVDALLRRVTAEAREAATNAARDAAAAAAAQPKVPADPDAANPEAIRKMAAMYDNMTPESAALIFKQMSDSGKLDTAVRILNQMQPRQASRVLAEIEPQLAAQLLEKMRSLKRTTPPAPPAPAGAASNVPTAAAPLTAPLTAPPRAP
ncbi:MAG: hypothetical protein K2X82_33080 [Gemmataceae bacterium]|nr:hypothetical protein [Gemmataceae bacterium]